MSRWFEVDRLGLSKLVEGRDKHRVIMELIQNAWDENSTHVHVEIHPIANRSCVNICVRDDNPMGFEDLTHAFTLFAESKKKKDPEKRGRFNFGEKIVLALCNHAEIRTTTGTIVFNESGRHSLRRKTASGSEFVGELRMTRQELEDSTRMLRLLLPPIPTHINGMCIPKLSPLKVVEATLTTEISDENDILRRSRRKTKVEIYECKDEEAYIYEMGIPVVATGDKYHVNVMQKVPLNTDRDNVTPAYLQDIRTIVLNAMHSDLSQDDCNEQWVRSASSDENCEPAAMKTVLDRRFGEKRVIYDPSDVEANSRAFSQGYVVVAGSQLNANEWKNVKKDNLMLPAGQVTPAKPKFTGSIPAMTDDQLSKGMKEVREYTRMLAERLMDVDLTVDFLDTDNSTLLAYYEREQKLLVYYVRQLGVDWFDLKTNSLNIDDLIIHEFGHQYESNHLSSQYYSALSMLGAKLKMLALQEPSLFGKMTA